MLTITAIIRARKGHEAALREALLEVVSNVRANEPATVGYYVSQDVTDPCVFTTYERYLDRAAMDRHNNSEAVARFFGIAKPLIDGEVTLVTGMELSAKSNDQVMMNLSGRAGQAAVCRDLGRHLLDRLALLHGGTPDQCESGGFSDRV